ncbi:hypothetical protein VU10_03820 [Desulfobulbus sp. US1]|nr:hypothetical protein [Desulfobulbus sp. US4]MCW5209315.1 hypothetical protein [Desulfobulbus sp. US1]
MEKERNLLVMTAARITFSTGSATTTTFSQKPQDLMAQTMDTKINVVGKNDTDAKKKLDKVTCPAGNAIQPNC